MAIFRDAIRGLVGLLTLFLLAGPLCAQNAFILPNAKTQFLDSNGKPFAGGSVQFYIPNTTTPKTTWSDSLATVPNADPVVLDSAGSAFIFGQGLYREQLFDVSNNLIWDGVTGSLGNGTVLGPTTSVVGDVALWNNTTGTLLKDGGVIRLAAGPSYFVDDINGNDSGSCLSALAGACKTLNGVVAKIAPTDIQGKAVTVNVAAPASSYAGLTCLAPWVGLGTVTFIGNTATPTNIAIAGGSSPAVDVENGCSIIIEGFSVSSTGSQTVQALTGSRIIMTAMDIGSGASGLTSIYSTRIGSYVEINDSIAATTFHTGTAGSYLLQASHLAELRISCSTACLKLTANITVGQYTALADSGSIVATPSASFNLNSFAVTGNKYRIQTLGSIQWNGNFTPNDSDIPGTAGTGTTSYTSDVSGPSVYFSGGRGASTSFAFILGGANGSCIQTQNAASNLFCLDNTGNGTWLNKTAPSAPGSGFTATWFDSTDLRLHDKDTNGNIGTTVIANAGTTHQFFNAMSTAGVLAGAQPACADISNAGTVCTQNTGTSGGTVPLLNGNNTISGNNSHSGTETFTNQIVGNMANTITSATAATLDDVKVSAATTTITGNTGSPITALSKFHIGQPTFTDSSSVTVTTGATLTIDNAPAQAGSVTITNAYALNVAAGSSLFGGKVFMSGLTAGSGTKALCLNATANEVQTDTSATICGISALRYKNLISEITPDQGLGVLNLRSESYRYKPEANQDDNVHVSLIADDMAALNPACANYSPHGVENYMDRCFEAYQVAYDKKLWQIIGELRHEIANYRDRR